MNGGWIKLHRKFIEWKWKSDANVVALFLHLLLSANHKDKEWQGIIIKKGQLITGRLELAKNVGLSVQQTRTAITKLKSTNEITIKTTNKYSIVTINNWDKYQDYNQQDNQRVTNNQPTNNQQITTNKNDKNEKNDKNTPNILGGSLQILDDEKFLEELKEKFPRHDIQEEIEKMKDWLLSTGKKKKDYKAFARNWIRNADPVKKERLVL